MSSFSPEQDRRSAHAVQVGKWPQWTFPALFSIRTIRSQSEVSEEYVHVLTVGDRAGRGRMVQFVQHLGTVRRSEEHTSELQSRQYLVCRLLLEKKKKK